MDQTAKTPTDGTKRRRMHVSVLLTALAMLIGMTLFEIAKQLFHRDITLWESHTITIIFSTIIATTITYFVRRHIELQNAELELVIRRKAQVEREQTVINEQLLAAMKQVKQLEGMMPICSYCKKIRDDEGYWSHVEEYISAHSEATFSHGICPECVSTHYPELEQTQGKPTDS